MPSIPILIHIKSGECDLVLVSSPKFESGKGLDIHIRTQIAHSMVYSYTSAAALRIGDDVLEVGAEGVGFFNGTDVNAKMPKTISGYSLKYEETDKKRRIFTIKLRRNEFISIKEFKGVVSVDISMANAENFRGSHGLSGSFPQGEMLARNGSTVLSDEVAFGQEWQVHNTEAMLFHMARAPQHPHRCIMPDMVKMMNRRGRRLLELDITSNKAEAACAHLADKDEKADCVYDGKHLLVI